MERRRSIVLFGIAKSNAACSFSAEYRDFSFDQLPAFFKLPQVLKNKLALDFFSFIPLQGSNHF